MNKAKEMFRLQLHVGGAYWVRDNVHWLPDLFIVRTLNYVCDRLENFLDGTPLQPSTTHLVLEEVIYGLRALGRHQGEAIETVADIGAKALQWVQKMWECYRQPASAPYTPRPDCPKCRTPSMEADDGCGNKFYTCFQCHHSWPPKKAVPEIRKNPNGKGSILLEETKKRFDAFKLQGMTIQELDHAIHLIAASNSLQGRVITPLHYPSETLLILDDCDSPTLLRRMTAEQKRVFLQQNAKG